MLDDRATLQVDGLNFGGWLGLEISRSLEQAAASFSFGATSRWPGQANPIRIRPGQVAEVLIGSELVVSGHVDSVSAELDAGARSLAVAGRSATADLVDCSATHKPGRWRKRKVEQIARELAAPFGVDVLVAPGVSTGDPLERFALESGETAYSAIERMARLRQLLVTDDPSGRLVLTRAGSGRAAVALVEGENILGGSSKADASDVFSTYTCRGQRVGSDDDFGEAVARVVGQAVDPEVARHRPLIVNAENQVSPAAAKARAEWEAATRLGKALEASLTVQGWRQEPGGALWAPNLLVTVDAPSLGLEGELLITGVTLSLGEAGTTARLELALPDAYKEQAPTPKSRKAAGAYRPLTYKDVDGFGITRGQFEITQALSSVNELILKGPP